MSLPKDPRVRLPKLLKAAKGQECKFQIPGFCNHDPETTVACHSMQAKHGHAAGLKAHDFYIVFGCSGCHDWYDGRINSGTSKAWRNEIFDKCNDATLKHCFREGILKC